MTELLGRLLEARDPRELAAADPVKLPVVLAEEAHAIAASASALVPVGLVQAREHGATPAAFQDVGVGLHNSRIA